MEVPHMSDERRATSPTKRHPADRRGFLYAVFGGLMAALAGWISGAAPRRAGAPLADPPTAPPVDGRIAALEAEVARLGEALRQTAMAVPLAQLEGEFGERVVFNKSELTVTNPEGVLLNLVATHGHVGIRFYKDFDFGNEQVTNPWHMGYIEGDEGYQRLAILRDWRFTAALWDEDGRLTLGRLDPYPPGNPPAAARVHVRGTLDEVQALVEASGDQVADIFQVVGRQGTAHFAVDSSGNVAVGSRGDPRQIILYDSDDGEAYSLRVTNGELALTRA
jgi:hypothetical protein